MSSAIHIQIGSVNSVIPDLDRSISRLTNVKDDLSSLRYSMDFRVLNTRGIGSQITAATNGIADIQADLNRLEAFVSKSLTQYQQAERSVNQKANQLVNGQNIITNLLNQHAASNTYELYNNTVGRFQDILMGMQYAGSAGIMHLLGWRYQRLNGLYQFKLLDDVKYGKLKLPIGKFIDYAENSKFNFLARMMAYPNPIMLARYKNKSIAELLYKRFSKQFPADISKLTNSVNKLRTDIAGADTFKNAVGAVKSGAGDLLKTSLKVGKANALTALFITGATETVGAGIKISENYSKYSGDVETLKTENAKAVGQAVNKTLVVSGTSIAGAAIGGAIGTALGGPVGTVIGATAGGIVGSWAGDKIAEFTAKPFESAAVHFKDNIYNATEAISEKVDAVKNGFEDVKNTASNLLANSKKFFSFG